MIEHLPISILQQLFLCLLFLALFFLLFTVVFFLIKQNFIQSKGSFSKLKKYNRLKMMYPYLSVFVTLQVSAFSLSGTILILSLIRKLPAWMLLVSLTVTFCSQLICWHDKKTEKNKRRIKFLQGMSLILLAVYFSILFYLSNSPVRLLFFGLTALTTWTVYLYAAVKLYQYSFRKKVRLKRRNPQHLQEE
ncbi:hypothetical protein [Enterococcus sp. UD-01]|jgi:hypothetical protein|uniref:hypothetical protein n=1 Tax=Enterococcus sp. UD-01 TaxID=3373911 RepID=UPI0038382E0A